MPNNTNSKKAKLRAAIEAKRLMRLKLDDAFDELHRLRKALKDAHKAKKNAEYLETLVALLDEQLEAKMESIMNEEPGGPIGCDGGGFSGGSVAGDD